MSDKLLPEVYTMRIPAMLSPVLHENLNVFKDGWSLAKLAEILPLEDVFYFISEQTRDLKYTTFITACDLFSILSHPENIEWMKKMETQYTHYLNRRKLDLTDEKSITISFDRFQCFASAMNSSVNYLIIDEAVINDKQDERSTKIDFIGNLMHRLLNFMDVNTLCKHPVTKYLLDYDKRI